MADDSLEIQKDGVPFHPCLTPRGMTWYDLNILTEVQQKLLNELKIDITRENNQYLAEHPEVRALIIIFLRGILRDKPKLKSVTDFAKDFFCGKPLGYLQSEVDEYLKAKGEPLSKEGNSAVNLDIESPVRESSLGDIATSFYHKEYYSWTTMTTVVEPSVVGEAVPEWGSYDGFPFGDFPFNSGSYLSGTTDPTDRREFELLFASRATPYSAESLEASTISLTREYMEIFGGVPKTKLSPLDGAEEDIDMLLSDIKMNERFEKEVRRSLSALVLEEKEENSMNDTELDPEKLSQSSYEDDFDVVDRDPSAILESMLND